MFHDQFMLMSQVTQNPEHIHCFKILLLLDSVVSHFLRQFMTSLNVNKLIL